MNICVVKLFKFYYYCCIIYHIYHVLVNKGDYIPLFAIATMVRIHLYGSLYLHVALSLL